DLLAARKLIGFGWPRRFKQSFAKPKGEIEYQLTHWCQPRLFGSSALTGRLAFGTDAEGDAEPPHGPATAANLADGVSTPISLAIASSWAMRLSVAGWVANRLSPPRFMPGTM